MTLSRLLLACSALTLCGVAQASTPVQVSLPGVNLPASHQVEGSRASLLYGRTGQVKGIDLPIFALSDVDQFSGLQLGVFLGAGRVRHQFGGVTINAINWHEGQDTGVNLGLVNLTNNVQGLNWGRSISPRAMRWPTSAWSTMPSVPPSRLALSMRPSTSMACRSGWPTMPPTACSPFCRW